MANLIKHARAITPSDATEIAPNYRAIYVGVGGDINILLANDTTPVLLKDVQTGTVLDMIVLKVYDTSTTATNLVGLY